MTQDITASAIALDIDGTIVDHNEHITPAVARQIRRLYEDGVPVILATGRSVTATISVARTLELANIWMVCSNGAVVARADRHADDYEITQTHMFDPGPALDQMVLGLPNALFAVEDITKFRTVPGFFMSDLWGHIEEVTFDDLRAHPVTRIVARDENQDSDAFHAAVQGLGLTECHYSVGMSNWLDVAPIGVTKASALDYVMEKLGTDRETVMAVGDGDNDFEMLGWAGYGVAMGNASTRVKEQAWMTTGDWSQDGLADALARVRV